MRLRPRRKPEQPAETGNQAPAPAERVTPDPLRENAHHPHGAGYQWRAGQKRRTVPRLMPGEAEAQLRAEHARRQAEEQAERARIAAELKAEKATRQAYVDGLFAEFERTSVWITDDSNGHRDIRNHKF